MSDHVSFIRLSWPGGVHRFRVHPMRPFDGEDREASQTPFGGLMHDGERAVLQRLLDKSWSSLDVSQTLFAGLVGGGEFQAEDDKSENAMIAQLRTGRRSARKIFPTAQALVSELMETTPLADFIPTVQAILFAAIYGVPKALAEKGLDAAAIDFADATRV